MPRVVDRTERLDDIAAAVRAVLGRDGVEQVTMRNVAAEVGCTTGLLTHWVPDRAGLLQVALEHTVATQTQRAAEVLLRHPDDLAKAIEAFLPLDDARRAEAAVWCGFGALAVSQPKLGRALAQWYRSSRTTLTEYLVACGIDRWAARGGADRIMATVDGVTMSATFDPAYWTPSRQRNVTRAVVDDVLARKEC